MDRTCKNGHRYFKTSDCPVCPICEMEKKKADPHFSSIGSPARRALHAIGITTLAGLARFTETEILALHGMGPNALGKLKMALEKEGLTFKSTKT